MNKFFFVIIVTYNGIRWIDKCLSSLKYSSIPLLPIVIDNNSSDNTVEFIKSNYSEVYLIENKENLGFGKANNLGLKLAVEQNADYVLLLNQDTWINPDTVEKLVEAQLENPLFGIISPVHLDGEGKKLDLNFSNCISFKSLLSIQQFNKSNKQFIEETNFVNAAAWLISKECLSRVGGFDPLFLHYGEDRDYCNRIIYNKFKIGVVFNAFIHHDRVYSEDNHFRKKRNVLFAIGLAQLKNINKSLLHNYIVLFYIRSRKIFKHLLMFDIKTLSCEIYVLFKLLKNIKQIQTSRKICKEINPNFL